VEILFVENLPKNATGKVYRRALREQYVAADCAVKSA
jgi:acyl-coenzyme A synthetase/AMP-(fatty) acid ligase